MDLRSLNAQALTRRHFFQSCGVGAAALGSLLKGEAVANESSAIANPMAPRQPHFPAKAKSVIYLHMAGAPPQQDLFDYKPKLVENHLKPCPDELLKNQRFAFIKGHPKLLGTPHKFAQYGRSGAWVSELLPHFTEVVDDVAFVKSMWTDQFNHAPAELLLYTGSARAGGASMGSWITYGLGSENQNLPGFVVMVSGGTDPTGGKSLWGSGFLPSVYQGVQCRTTGDPILYVNNPEGMSSDVRRHSLDALRKLNEFEHTQFGDPETLSRISQYELAFRMQMAVPEAMNLAQETQETVNLYGAEVGGSSFANNCLLARRLVERGVRFVQLFDWGWDIHGTAADNDVVTGLPKKCKEVDKPIAGLLKDLKRRGMLDETLVVWDGEFGRTSMNEERNGSKFLGRDHHPHCFTIWMAGGGIQGGLVRGETDELGYFITKDKTSVRDLQATILHLLGLDPWKHTYAYQGLNQRLIGPAGEGTVLKDLIA